MTLGDIVVVSILGTTVIYLLWHIGMLLLQINLALSTLVVLALPDTNEAKKLVLDAADKYKVVPITRFNL